MNVIMNYIKRSWNGELSPIRAFVINFIILQLLAQFVAIALLTPVLISIQFPLIGIVILNICILLVFYIWAATGVWRSSQRMQSQLLKGLFRVVLVGYIALPILNLVLM